MENSGKFATAGGNIEATKFCEQHHSLFEVSCKAVIRFHWNDIFRYIYGNEIEQHDEYDKAVSHDETKISSSKINIKKLNDFGLISISSSNNEGLSFNGKKRLQQMIIASMRHVKSYTYSMSYIFLKIIKLQGYCNVYSILDFIVHRLKDHASIQEKRILS